MEKTVRLNADQREDLVAYLDGELPAEQAQQIDQIIARSEVARHEVEALSRTWEMLDILPSAPASEDFTAKTMTHLKVMEEPYLITGQWWFVYLRRTLAITGWLGALVVCGWLGFQVTRYWIPNPHEELIEDLPVIENLDQYQEADNMEFLIQLKNSGLFDDTQEK
jgi:anti-sigma factor RsiW